MNKKKVEAFFGGFLLVDTVLDFFKCCIVPTAKFFRKASTAKLNPREIENVLRPRN